ncbi:MAG: hypothetical protein WCI41_03280 [bacterium]
MKSKNIRSEIVTLQEDLKKIPSYLFTVIKGQEEDIIPGFSDLDLRIVVDTDSIEELNKINEILLNGYKKIIKKSKVKFRMFEHPPLILNYKLLKKGLGNANEISTWYFMGGKTSIFTEIKKLYLGSNFSISDEKRFRGVLANKENYNVEGELFYDFIDVNTQKKYFLAWHYYSTSVYVFMSLYLKKRLSGKSQGLRMTKKYFPNLVYANKNKLLKSVIDKDVGVSDFQRNLMKDWYFISEAVGKENSKSSVTSEKMDILRLCYISVVLSLNKISRLNIYLGEILHSLNFSEELTENLVIREIEDVSMIYGSYTKALKYVLNDKGNKSKEVKVFEEMLLRFDNLLKDKTPDLVNLKKYLVFFEDNIKVMQDFFYEYLMINYKIKW